MQSDVFTVLTTSATHVCASYPAVLAFLKEKKKKKASVGQHLAKIICISKNRLHQSIFLESCISETLFDFLNKDIIYSNWWYIRDPIKHKMSAIYEKLILDYRG